MQAMVLCCDLHLLLYLIKGKRNAKRNDRNRNIETSFILCSFCEYLFYIGNRPVIQLGKMIDKKRNGRGNVSKL